MLRRVCWPVEKLLEIKTCGTKVAEVSSLVTVAHLSGLLSDGPGLADSTLRWDALHLEWTHKRTRAHTHTWLMIVLSVGSTRLLQTHAASVGLSHGSLNRCVNLSSVTISGLKHFICLLKCLFL